MADSDKQSVAAGHLERALAPDTPVIKAAEKKLVRKQDLVITTLLSGCYFFAYLVRSYFLIHIHSHLVEQSELTTSIRIVALLGTRGSWASRRHLA